MKKKYLFVLSMLLAVGTFTGCGSGTDRTSKESYQAQAKGDSVLAETSVPAEAPSVEGSAEESKSENSLHKFDITQDVLFTYEYDTNEELSKIIAKDNDAEYAVIKTTCDKDGHLTLLEANKLKAEYNTKGQIVAVERGSDSYTITYNSTTGYITVVCKKPNDRYHPESTTEYDSDFNPIYYEYYYLSSEQTYYRGYREYSNGICSHEWIYDGDELLKYEKTYHDNGQVSEDYEYNKKGGIIKHNSYDRTGKKIN